MDMNCNIKHLAQISFEYSLAYYLVWLVICIIVSELIL